MILFAFFYALYFFIYASFFSSCELGMQQDELYDYNHRAAGMYVAAGRWGLALYRSLTWGYSGAVCMLLSGLYLCCSFFVQRRALRMTNRYSFLLYGVISLGTVQFVHHLRFNMQADAVALSVLLASVAFYYVSSGLKLKKLIVGASCLVVAVGFYQASFLVFVCLALGRSIMALTRGVNVRSSLKALAVPAVVTIVSVSISTLFAWGCKNYFCSSDALELQTIYQTSFIKTHLYWDRELSLHTWYIHLKGLLRTMAGFAPGLGLCCVLVWIPLCLSAVCQFRRYGFGRTAWLCALSLLLLGTPFVFPVAFASGSFDAMWTVRTYLAAPAACATLWACCADLRLWNGGCVSRFSLSSLLGLAIVALLAAYQASAVSQYNSVTQMPRHIDSFLVEYEGRKLAADYGDDLATLKIVCIATERIPMPYLTEAPFLRNLTSDRSEPCGIDPSLPEKMPVWPAHGSMVRVAPGLIIVHFPVGVYYQKNRPGIFCR